MSQEANQPRDTDLTVVLSRGEKDAFRQKCAKIGAHCSTQARRLMNAWNPPAAPENSNAPRLLREYPSRGHVAKNFPNRASRGGAPRPARF